MDLSTLRAATGASEENASLYLPFLVGTMRAYSIDTPRRQAAFLAQIGHESKHLTAVEENLNYSVDGLLATFGRHRISEADARRLGRIDRVQGGVRRVVRPADQKGIANIIYGGEWGRVNLGNTLPGDGWRHRGMGLKQLTGRANHQLCGEDLGEDFVSNPERLMLPFNAALSAGWFWHHNKLNHWADQWDMRTLTVKVNGGLLGLHQRTSLATVALLEIEKEFGNA